MQNNLKVTNTVYREIYMLVEKISISIILSGSDKVSKDLEQHIVKRIK